GYTEILGVREEWRGMRVATALLVAAMRAYAADGMEYAGLGIDSPEQGGDFGLFGQLGYEPTRHSLMVTLTVCPHQATPPPGPRPRVPAPRSDVPPPRSASPSVPAQSAVFPTAQLLPALLRTRPGKNCPVGARTGGVWVSRWW